MTRHVLLAALLSLPTAAAATPDWSRQVVPGHGVSLELPGAVEHRQRERSVIVGKVVSDTIVHRDDAGWCSATVTRAPRMALRLAGESKILTSARDNVLGDYAGEIVSWTPTQRDGRAGMRLEFVSRRDPARPERGIAEFFTFEDLVVTLAALQTDGTDLAAVERAFASVDLDG